QCSRGWKGDWERVLGLWRGGVSEIILICLSLHHHDCAKCLHFFFFCLSEGVVCVCVCVLVLVCQYVSVCVYFFLCFLFEVFVGVCVCVCVVVCVCGVGLGGGGLMECEEY